MTRLAFDSRTPYVLNVGVVTFAVAFAKALGLIPPIAEIKTLLRRRPTRHAAPPCAIAPEDNDVDRHGEFAGLSPRNKLDSDGS